MPATFGNPLVDRVYVDGWANFYMNWGSGIPNDFTIGSFSCYAKQAGKVQFLIYRLDGTAYSIIGKSEVITATVGVNKVELSSPIEAKAGDIIGWYVPGKGVIAFEPSSNRVFWGNQGGSGTDFERSRSGGRSYSISIGEADPVEADPVEEEAPDVYEDDNKEDAKCDCCFLCTGCFRWATQESSKKAFV